MKNLAGLFQSSTEILSLNEYINISPITGLNKIVPATCINRVAVLCL